MQLSDFTSQQQRSSALKKVLSQWTPRIEEKVIDLFNKGYSENDVQRILVQEENFKLPKYTDGYIDFKVLKRIFQKLLDTGKVTFISKDKKALDPVKDKQILDFFIENKKTFEGNPKDRLVKAFNAKYNLTKGTNLKPGTGIATDAIDKAFNRAIEGKYPEYDKLFKGRELSEFFKTRHANIFPQVKTLDTVIKKALKDGYLLDETQYAETRMERLKKEYAKAAGIADDAKLENNFLTRMRRILALYGGTNTERYEQKLYDQIKAPPRYMDSKLQKNLIAIGQHAGRMSNKDMALALGLGKQKADFLNDLQWASNRIGKIYGLPKVVKKGAELFMAGDHTDSKALMESLPNYKKNFMRIAYVSHGLNQFKAKYDQKINALRRQAELGFKFDKGIYTTGMPRIHTFMKGTDKKVDLRGKKFNPAIHERKQVGIRSQGYYNDPFSGPLTQAEKKAGGRTIPAAIAKLQKQFSELTGGYRLGGFDIKKPGAVGTGNIEIKKFLQPRLDIRKSPVSEAILETIRNLKYSAPEDAASRIEKANLNVVDRALVGREGLTTKGRINILKRFGPQDLKGSGYLEGMRIASRQSPKVTAIMNKGIDEAVRLANVNDGDICNIFGMKRGGLAGGGCGRQMRQALEEAPNETWAKISESGSSRLKNIANSFLNFAKRGGKFGAAAGVGAAAAVGVGLLKPFRNDDPTTYLSDENQQKNMLIEMLTGAIHEKDLSSERPAILDWQLPVLGAETALGTAVTAPSTIEAARSKAFGRKPSGYTKTALKTLGRGLMTTGTPLGLAALEPLHIAGQIEEGASPLDIATNPWNWLGPAFMPSMTKAATKGLGAASNIAKVMRLGLPMAAVNAWNPIGWTLLAGSLGIEGVKQYQDYKNKRGWFSEE